MARIRVQTTAPDYTPLPYGLFSVVQLPPLEEHWELGVQFQPPSHAAAHVTTDPCTGAPPAKTSTQSGFPVLGADPFTPYVMIDCSPVGHWEDYVQRTQEALEYGEERAAEREFWTGEHGTLPHLAASAQVLGDHGEVLQPVTTDLTPGGGAVNASEGLVLLEQALASCYGGQGTIHMTRGALIQLRSLGFTIKEVGDHLETPSSHKVAVGSGYPGTGPDGSTPTTGEQWVYATGAIALRRSPEVDLPATREQSLNRLTNTMVLVAERTYVIAIDTTCLYAVRVLVHGQSEGV